MYKIVVDEEMPKTCRECGLYYINVDDFGPFDTAECEITGKTIGWAYQVKEVLPEWCPIEGSIPKETPNSIEDAPLSKKRQMGWL